MRKRVIRDFDISLPLQLSPAMEPVIHITRRTHPTLNFRALPQACASPPGQVNIKTRLRPVYVYESIDQHEKAGQPRIGIGAGCRIENAIIDKNVRVGNNVVISPAGKPENLDHPLCFIRDGVVVIPKNMTIPHGTVI